MGKAWGSVGRGLAWLSVVSYSYTHKKMNTTLFMICSKSYMCWSFLYLDRDIFWTTVLVLPHVFNGFPPFGLLLWDMVFE